MSNDVYRAGDAVLVLGADDPSTPEGQAADALVSRYDLSNVIGRLTQVSVTIRTGVTPFFEIGRRYPSHLRPGLVLVFGSAERAHVNGALLRLMLGEGAQSPPGSPNFVQPAFNIVATLKDPARPAQESRLTLFGARFDTWNYAIPTEAFVMEKVTFQALRAAFEET